MDTTGADPNTYPVTGKVYTGDPEKECFSTTTSFTLAAPTLSHINMTSWGNSKTNNDSKTLTINESESVRFNATANQTIDTWNWYNNGTNQSNNFDNYTTSWSVNGTHTVSVNATNANGTSKNTVEWTVTVKDITPPSITDITNTTPTSDSVTITWNTDENSSSLVRYGTVNGTYDQSNAMLPFPLSHWIGRTVP